MAATPTLAHGIALKRYNPARGRLDLHIEALLSSNESDDNDVGSNASSDTRSDAGSMVAQFSSAVQARESLKPTGPRPELDPMLLILSSQVLSFMSA